MCLHRLHVTFIDKEGERHEFEVAKGDNLLDIAQANDLEMEGMAFRLTASPHANKHYCRGVRRILRLLDMPCYRRRPRGL